jgi:hypothetical protein
MYVCIYKHIHVRTYIRIRACMKSRACTHMHMHMHRSYFLTIYTNAQMHTHTLQDLFSNYLQKCAYTCTRAQTLRSQLFGHMQVCMYLHMHTCTCIHRLAFTVCFAVCEAIYVYLVRHTHISKHTYINTYTISLSLYAEPFMYI